MSNVEVGQTSYPVKKRKGINGGKRRERGTSHKRRRGNDEARERGGCT